MAEYTAAGHTNGLAAARRLDSVNKTNRVLAAQTPRSIPVNRSLSTR